MQRGTRAQAKGHEAGRWSRAERRQGIEDPTMLDVAGNVPNLPAPAGAIDVRAGALEVAAFSRDHMSGHGGVDQEAAALGRIGTLDSEDERGHD